MCPFTVSFIPEQGNCISLQYDQIKRDLLIVETEQKHIFAGQKFRASVIQSGHYAAFEQNELYTRG